MGDDSNGDNSDISEGALRRKLVEDSDEENALQEIAADQDDYSDSEML